MSVQAPRPPVRRNWLGFAVADVPQPRQGDVGEPSTAPRSGVPGWTWAYIISGLALALIFGVTIGRASVDPKASAAYVKLQHANASQSTQISDDADTIHGWQSQSAALDARQSALTTAEASVSAAAAEISASQAAINAAQVPGDGTYIVGQDVKPGSYTSTDNQDCYWAFLSNVNDDSSIRSNDLGDGLMHVTLRKGDIFQTKGCSTWNPS